MGGHTMSKKLLLGALLMLACAVVLPQPASAHVLIADSTNSVGAVLHVVPDDDPVAGQESNLFFDVESQKIDQNSTKLAITDASTGQTSVVPTKATGSLVTADYTFPTQGVYKLSLTVGSSKTYVFNYSQRVSRGVIGSAQAKPVYPLANMALVFCAVVFALLLVILFNHRREMWRRSTF